MLMFHHNNQLSSEHPFATQPGEWPFGIIWGFLHNDNTEKNRFSFIGNIIGFWLEVCFLSIYIGILLADQITRRRNVHVLSDRARSRLYNTLGFCLLAGLPITCHSS